MGSLPAVVFSRSASLSISTALCCVLSPTLTLEAIFGTLSDAVGIGMLRLSSLRSSL